MTEREKQLTLKWIRCWQKAAPELEQKRHEDIRHANTQKAVKALAGMEIIALRTSPARTYSGLVEQQYYFQQLHA